MNILVIRFRQMGDAILTTVVLNTLRRTFPGARIDYVLNDRLCPLFIGHPSIDHVIPFTDKERHDALTYLRKVWHTVHHVHYDIIIDMRSTMNTLLFSLFSPFSRYRIGIRKPYTHVVFNHRIDACKADESMIDHNLAMLKPLEKDCMVRYTRDFTLAVTREETARYMEYLSAHGIDFSKPVVLCGVTTKLLEKKMDDTKTLWLLRQIMEAYPSSQLIFNYAPGREHDDAVRLWHELHDDKRIFINVEASGQRELVALASLSTVYVGNEGGARHIVQAVGTPSFAFSAPHISIATWIPQNGVPAFAMYNDEPMERIWQALDAFLHRYCKK